MMARGLVVLDENLWQLLKGLKDTGIRVIIPESGKSDKFIAEQILPNRTFITRNTKDFLAYALGNEIGIISLEGLSFIDPTPNASNTTVQILSKAIIEFSLWSRSSGFLLELKDNGKHILKEF